MDKDDVVIGGLYAVLVSGKLCPVKILSKARSPAQGWNGINKATGKKVRIKTVAKLRGPWVNAGNEVRDTTGKLIRVERI